MKHKSLSRSVLSIAMLAFTGIIYAANFTVAPMNVVCSKAERTKAITITNNADQPLILQTSVANLIQKDGASIFEPTNTKQLLVSPPVIKIAAHKKQLVRIAYRGDFDKVKKDFVVKFKEILPKTTNLLAPSGESIQPIINVALTVDVGVSVQTDKYSPKVADLH
jgi:fimbrial chaperone protein